MKFNLRKITKNSKFLDIFSYAFCGLYFLFVILFASNEVFTQLQYEKKLDNLLNYVASVNKKVEEEKFFNSSNSNQNTPSTEPLFTDGKTALITAYNNLLKANSFYVEANGSLTTVTLGITVKVSIFTRSIKYNEHKFYEYRANKLIESNASGILQGVVESSSNSGAKMMSENGNVRYYESNNTYLENNIPQLKLENKNLIYDNEKLLYCQNLYTINEDTILSVPYFNVKYKNGIPVNYFVQVELDPILSCKNYGKALQTSIDSIKKLPVFNKIMIGATIDAYGNLVGLTTSDCCILTMDTPIGIKDCPCTMTQTYAISGINEEILYIDKDF